MTFVLKFADHPVDRLAERTSLPPETIARLRESARDLHLSPGHYYLPLKDHVGGHAGYAAFKTVEPRDQLVLATVLGPGMHPKGSSLSHLMRQPVSPKMAAEKLAVSPGLYASAIRSTADRTGARVAPGLLDRLRTGNNMPALKALSANVKDPRGTIQSVGQAKLRNDLESMPYANSEWGAGSSVASIDQHLAAHGRLTAQPGAGQGILSGFGPAKRGYGAASVDPHAATGVQEAATSVGRKRAKMAEEKEESSTGLKILRGAGGILASDAAATGNAYAALHMLQRTPVPATAVAIGEGMGVAPNEYVLIKKAPASGFAPINPGSPMKGRPLVHIDAHAGEAEIAHEFGHLKNWRPFTRAMAAPKAKAGEGYGSTLRAGTALSAGAGVSLSRSLSRLSSPVASAYAAGSDDPSWTPALTHLGLATPMLVDEAAASGRAMNYLIKNHGWGQGLRRGAGLLPAFGSYAAMAGMPAAITGARKYLAHRDAKAKHADAVFPGDTGSIAVDEIPDQAAQQRRLVTERDTQTFTPAFATGASSQALSPAGPMTRIAAAPEEEPPAESHTGRNLAMAGAAAAPFAGMIGQQKMIHEGKGPLVSDYNEFRSKLQPGDVLLTGSPEFSKAKGLINLVTGTPKGYHVAVVGQNGHTVGESHPLTGFAKEPLHAEERMQVLRPNLTAAQRRTFAGQIDSHAQAGGRFERSAAKSIRDAGFSAEDAVGHAAIARGGLYDTAGGVRAGVKELFMPKLRSDGAIEAARAHGMAQKADFRQNATVQGRGVGPLIETNSAKGIDSAPEAFKRFAPQCAGDVCSTVPAQLLPKGQKVVPGKLPNEVLPSDYLRSTSFKPVARFDPKPQGAAYESLMRHAPTVMRAGVGLGMAGAIYGGSKLWDRFRGQKKEPRRAGSPATT